MPRLIANNAPVPACGGSKSLGVIDSGLIAWCRSISPNSMKVSAASTSPPTSALRASPFFAMHGPMNTTFIASPYSRRSARAVATIGETIGANAGTRSGWYRSTYPTIAGRSLQ